MRRLTRALGKGRRASDGELGWQQFLGLPFSVQNLQLYPLKRQDCVIVAG